MLRPVRSAAVPLCLLVALLGASCSDGGGETPSERASASSIPPSTDIPTGKLVGMQGTIPYTELPEWFREDIEEIAPALSDYSFAAEAYDSVMITALAAELARSDAPGRFASEIIGVSSFGQKCSTWQICSDHSDKLGNLDYDGVSGAIEMLASGEPGEASFAVMRFEDDDNLVRTAVKSAVAEPSFAEHEAVDPTRGPRADGVLRLGMLLPTSGPDAQLGEAERAGIRLAVQHINDRGGVLGRPVELIDGDSGSNDLEAIDAAATLMEDGVDAILGAGRANTTLAVLPSVTSAGIVLFSPSSTSRVFAFTDHNGLLFRLAPSDVLQGQVLAEVVASDGVTDVVVLTQQGASTEGAAEDFRLAYEAADGEIAATVRFDAESVDPAVYNAVLATPSDGIVIFGDVEPAGALITSLSTAGRGPEQGPYYMSNITASLADYVN